MKSLSQIAFERRALFGFLFFVLLAGGLWGFLQLGKREDSTFVIKTAALSCRYPGASPIEVEELITEPIEREVQGMPSVYKITSESGYGVSMIRVELDPGTPAHEIPQRWDELRRRVLNVAPRLPEGASEVQVSDDFGDLYGLYFGLVADPGFDFSELRQKAQQLRIALQRIEGVERVTLFGEQEPVINLYISLSALAGFSIRPEAIITTLGEQNRLLNSGSRQAGELRIEIIEGSTYHSLEALADQLLMASDGKQYRLGDVARIERNYRQPPTSLMRIGGLRAIGIGISTEAGSDVVKVGKRVRAALENDPLPVGMRLEELYPEDQIARQATNSFLLNLVESLLIVVGMIMLTMGLREGIVIGSSLLFSIGGTLLLMLPLGEGLNRTSLAGFIIAMGMLVDNAIVVVDNARQRTARGQGLREALIRGAEEPAWSLLGATLIGIFSFLPLYLAPSSVAEIIQPLFVVVALSLLLSWLLALSQTPLWGEWLLRGDRSNEREHSSFNRRIERLLGYALRHRIAIIMATITLFALSLWQMDRMPQNFFPNLDKPYFRADVILPAGYDIRYTEEQMARMEQWLQAQPEVKRVSLTVGGTPPRYYLASSSVSGRPNFGNLLVELHDQRHTAALEEHFASWVEEQLPDVWLRSSLFKLSPVPDAAIEFGFIGPDIDTLQRLTNQAEGLLWRNPQCKNIRQSWGNRIPTWRPLYSQMKGQRIGISRTRLAEGITLATAGYPLGEYREGDRVLPILLKQEPSENESLEAIGGTPLFSPRGAVYSLDQAISGSRFEFRRSRIDHFNRERVMKVQCDPRRGVNTQLLQRELQAQIARIPLPAGYRMRLFGEQESQAESNQALADKLPLTLLLIFTTLILLFGNYRDSLLVLILQPLIFIGVVLGLSLLGKVFNFFALLGLLGLVGMNCKNAVVLIEAISRLRAAGREPYEALIEATRSRVIPVVTASGTTILGMIPLLFDSLFGAMAATIMGGLLIGTLLTIVVLPLLYSLFYRINPPTSAP